MTYELVFSEKFRKKVKKLDKKNQIMILKKIKTLKNYPSAGKPLKSSSGRLRSLRIGKYRVIYRINGKIFILVIGHRKDVYHSTF